MSEASVIQLAGAFFNIKFIFQSTLWYNGLVVFYRYKNGYKENIVLINQTAKKILPEGLLFACSEPDTCSISTS
mgnify:CR=1 FL=1